MHKIVAIGLFSVAALVTSFSTQAAIVPWSASLSGSNEVPANAGTGTGSAFGTLDDSTGLLSWNITFSDLTGPLTAMHFHGAASPFANAGVQLNIGAISGLGSPSNGSATVTPAQMVDLLAENWYINAHTVAFGGGEIRGQVLLQAQSSVPEPATLGLLAVGMLGLAASRRRSKQA